MPKPQTAKQILGLTDLRGDYLQGNVESVVVARESADFIANKDPWPAGEPAPEPYFYVSRE